MVHSKKCYCRSNWSIRNDSSSVAAILHPVDQTSEDLVERSLYHNNCYCVEKCIRPQLFQRPKKCLADENNDEDVEDDDNDDGAIVFKNFPKCQSNIPNVNYKKRFIKGKRRPLVRSTHRAVSNFRNNIEIPINGKVPSFSIAKIAEDQDKTNSTHYNFNYPKMLTSNNNGQEKTDFNYNFNEHISSSQPHVSRRVSDKLANAGAFSAESFEDSVINRNGRTMRDENESYQENKDNQNDEKKENSTSIFFASNVKGSNFYTTDNDGDSSGEQYELNRKYDSKVQNNYTDGASSGEQYNLNRKYDSKVQNNESLTNAYLKQLSDFRKDHYFETHSTEDLLKTVPEHTCVHRFGLDDRFLPEALNADVYGESRCIICGKPMESPLINQTDERLSNKTGIFPKFYKYGLAPKKIYVGNDSNVKIEMMMKKGKGDNYEYLSRKQPNYFNTFALRYQNGVKQSNK